MKTISSPFCPPNSKAAFGEAQRYLSGGVNSPVRAFKAVGGTPLFIKKARDARLYDLDGNSYVDFIGSWGPMILGHAHPEPLEAIRKVLGDGVSFGAPTLLETQLAKLIVEAFPSIEQVRMVNSGTEATMSAIRLARGVTGREKVVKFEGCYHGHGDSFLIAAGSGALTMGTPDSPGLVKGNAAATLVARYNDLAQVEALFQANRGEIAAVIIEPVAGNMGTVPATSAFLRGLRGLTKDAGALLIFDEVMTGFRLAWGGAQTVYEVQPDLTCLGKIIGGGVPVGAYGGRREWMEHISPQGKVYQAGTLSGNPLGMAAGGATLNYLKKHPDTYRQLEEKGAFFEKELRGLLHKSNQPAVINRFGSMLTIFFTTRSAVNNFEAAKTTDTKKYAAFFQALLKEGVYFPPSAFEALFLSLAHSESELRFTLAAVRKALHSL